VGDDAVSLQFVVQFPHPGAEHNPGSAQRQSWNIGKHRRKFLQSYGRCVADDDSLSECDLVFWGEWEPPSYVIKRWEQKGSLPRFLHRPAWELPANGPRQNTDPWVFGESFKYSNCHQLIRRKRWEAIQSLTPGSIILFGSTVGIEFVLDTVFVVKDSCRFSPNKPPESDEAFRVCTVESLLTSGSADDPFTLYRGATYEASINGMYSFVPCRRADAGDMRFPRPPISLPGYLNPKSTQTPSGANKPRSAADVHEQWETIRKQVFEAGCLLAVWFSTPQLEKDSTVAQSPKTRAKLSRLC
jgi:hypothetical protein